MGAPGEAVAVRHRCQEHDRGSFADRPERFGNAFNRCLPFGLALEEGIDQGRDIGVGDRNCIGNTPYIAVQAEGCEGEFEPFGMEVIAEGAEKVEDDVVHVENEKRIVAADKLADLAGGFRVVAHPLPRPSYGPVVAIVPERQRPAGSHDGGRVDAGFLGEALRCRLVREDELENTGQKAGLLCGGPDVSGFYACYRQETAKQFGVARDEGKAPDRDLFGTAGIDGLHFEDLSLRLHYFVSLGVDM
jgi:hypothetical protein